jgi:hypothetical protein
MKTAVGEMDDESKVGDQTEMVEFHPMMFVTELAEEVYWSL